MKQHRKAQRFSCAKQENGIKDSILWQKDDTQSFSGSILFLTANQATFLRFFKCQQVLFCPNWSWWEKCSSDELKNNRKLKKETNLSLLFINRRRQSVPWFKKKWMIIELNAPNRLQKCQDYNVTQRPMKRLVPNVCAMELRHGVSSSWCFRLEILPPKPLHTVLFIKRRCFPTLGLVSLCLW